MTIEQRLAEYSTALRTTAAGLINVAEAVEATRPDVNPETQGIRDAARLYVIIADDLDKILAGEELKPWRIEAQIGDPS